MLLTSIIPLLFFLFSQNTTFQQGQPAEHLLAERKISLEKRYENKFVNDVFKDNILLNIAYMEGKIAKKDEIDWKEVKKPFKYRFQLPSGKTFSFHEDVLPKYRDSVVLTTKAHFNFQEGFKSDGYLTGDGVCHLASLIYWAAKSAKLDAYAPTNHDFAQIPQISKEYGVSIYSVPGQTSSNEMQNLYITNNLKNPILFEFDYNGEELKISILEIKEKQNSFPS